MQKDLFDFIKTDTAPPSGVVKNQENSIYKVLYESLSVTILRNEEENLAFAAFGKPKQHSEITGVIYHVDLYLFGQDSIPIDNRIHLYRDVTYLITKMRFNRMFPHNRQMLYGELECLAKLVRMGRQDAVDLERAYSENYDLLTSLKEAVKDAERSV